MKNIYKITAFGAAMLFASGVGAQTLSPGFSNGTYALGTDSFVETASITALSTVSATFMDGSAFGMPDMCEIVAVSGSHPSCVSHSTAQFFLEDATNQSNGIWYRGPGVVEASFSPATMGDGFTSFPLTQTVTLNSRYNSLTLNGNAVSSTAAATQTFTLTEAQVRAAADADFIANCMGGGSSSSSSSTPAETAASIIQSDVTRVTRSAVTANNSMISQGLERFIADREAGDDLASRNFNSFSFLPTLNANDGLFAGGSFFAQSGSAGGAYRQVTFGEFDVQHESGSGTTLSFNGRMAWERSLNDDAMIAYFLGAEVNQSNIKGSYSGDQTRYGVTGGMYGYMALENDLFLSGYGSLGVGRSDLDITDGASTPSVITGDYSSRTASIGGKLSGSVDYDAYELRPSVGLNMVKTWIGDITLDNSGSAITSSVGDTTFAELIAKPEFIFPMEQQAGSNMVPVASAAPRFICERSDASGVVTKDCGGGVELGIDATSEDGMTNFNASVRFDRLGSVNRQGLNLQAELRF